jgi:predicted Zn-dependent protease
MNTAERFEALLASGKDNALVRFGLGLAYLNAAEPGRAAVHLRAAVGHDPDYSAAWKLLGRALAESGCPQAGARGLPQRHRGGREQGRQAGGEGDDGVPAPARQAGRRCGEGRR